MRAGDAPAGSGTASSGRGVFRESQDKARRIDAPPVRRRPHCAPSMSSSHRAPRGAVRARKRVLRWGFLAQPAQCMHPAGARSSAARRLVVLPSQVTLARGLESDPPVVPAMSSLVGLRRCMLASIAIQAVSGAASTCALHDLRVDMFSPVRRTFRHCEVRVGADWQRLEGSG